jgi:preprotein translocase subunit SecG
LIILILLQKSEGGGLGIGQAGGSGGLGDFLTARSTSNILTKTTSVLAFCFFLTSLSLVFITNENYNKESIIDSSDDSIIDRLDLIPEEFDVENQQDEELSVPSE